MSMWHRLRSLFGESVRCLSSRGLLLASLNGLYFGVILVGALLVQGRFVSVYELPSAEGVFSVDVGLPFLIIGIFVFNLFVSGLLLTTLSGLLFFVLPVGVLFLRALMWGVLLGQLSSPEFFLAFPTLVLEGEAYVIAAVAGVVLGLSWFQPNWIYKGANLTRAEALKRAMKESLYLFVFVVILLFVGAVVEAVTIFWAMS